jgi:hypothetical protein
MDARRALRRSNGRIIVKPFVVLAARCLGPGRLRLEMVKLAHDLGDAGNSFEVLSGGPVREPLAFNATPAQTSRRAA